MKPVVLHGAAAGEEIYLLPGGGLVRDFAESDPRNPNARACVIWGGHIAHVRETAQQVMELLQTLE